MTTSRDCRSQVNSGRDDVVVVVVGVGVGVGTRQESNAIRRELGTGEDSSNIRGMRPMRRQGEKIQGRDNWSLTLLWRHMPLMHISLAGNDRANVRRQPRARARDRTDQACHAMPCQQATACICVLSTSTGGRIYTSHSTVRLCMLLTCCVPCRLRAHAFLQGAGRSQGRGTGTGIGACTARHGTAP
jgi:hypothetical protein